MTANHEQSADATGRPLARSAPPSFTAHLADDVADQADSITGWAQEYVQLSAGSFQGRLDEVRQGPLQVFHEYTSQATYQSCQPWHDSIWFGLSSANSGEELWFNGNPVPSHTLLFSPARSDFTLRTPPEFGIYGMVVNLAHLAERCETLFGDDLPAPWRHAGAVRLGPESYARLRASLNGLLATARSQPDPLAQTHLIDALADEILLSMLDGTAHGANGKPVSRCAQRHIDQVRLARALALAPDNPAISVEALCERLHLTRRTLQNCFQDVLGMSPLHFVRSVRLNAVRQALRDPVQDHLSIQEIATRWSFWNLSYLSYDYKRLFGESPSQTRQIAQARRTAA